MRKFLLIFCLFPIAAQAQLSNWYSGVAPVGHRSVLYSPGLTSTTRLDTILASHAIVTDSILSALMKYGIMSGNFGSISAALTAARPSKSPVWIPWNATGALNPTTSDSNLVIWDFHRTGRWDVYGRRTWGYRSIWEMDSTNFVTNSSIRRTVDSVTIGGKIMLGDGTVTFDSLNINKAIVIEGTTTARPTGTTSWPLNPTGAVLASNSSDADQHLVRAGVAGAELRHINLLGNNRANGSGFYGYRGNGEATTQGDYHLHDVFSSFHGGHGITFVAGDGNSIWHSDAFNNKKYGISITSPYGDYLDGYRSIPTSNGGIGTVNMVIGGRTRFNTLGGIRDFQQAGSIYIGVESIRDSTHGFTLSGTTSNSANTQFSVRPLLLGNDIEFTVPRQGASNYARPVSNMYMKTVRAGTIMNNYWGSVHTESSTYTADAGTNTTTIVDAALLATSNDYYIGWNVDNSTRSVTGRTVTDYDAATKTLTLDVAVGSQTAGDTYSIYKNPDRGIWADSVYSAVLLNNSMAHQADTMIAVHNFGNFLFLGANLNFNPKTNIKALGGADVNWASLALDRLTTGGRLEFFTNTKMWLQNTADSIVVETQAASSGININAQQSVLDLNRTAGGNVRVFRQVTDNASSRLYIGADVNPAVGTSSVQNISIGPGSSYQTISVQNDIDSTKLSFALPIELTGQSLTERFADIQLSNATPTPTLASQRIRLYNRSNHLYVYNGTDSVNADPYSGSATWNIANLTAGTSDSTSVTVTGAAVGDVVIVGHSGITTPTANIHLFGHVVSANTVRVFARNESGGTYDVPSGTVKVRVWK